MISFLVAALVLSTTAPYDANPDSVESTPVDEMARVVSGFKPVYPPSLMDVDLFPIVTVTLAVYVDKYGKPIRKLNQTRVSLPGEFICAAEQAVEKCQWAPALWGGGPVGSWVIYEVKFVHPKYGPKKK